MPIGIPSLIAVDVEQVGAPGTEVGCHVLAGPAGAASSRAAAGEF
eukprot:CAMPEP_0179446224 /NCGR_PEP_ID=MMETSP0799-20121207/29630_1 /TAXON_ID=46947 /ORGANISM="Geminigera cryophila, Strain CCMP2564" /LENGTH=44 /DNA_ID= /DNA_START= /DNA_END= /DNA_ORIENTATION=